jgi:segregation and condensation protein A
MDEDRVLARVGEFHVEVPVFRGPFRLLADMILERQVDVCDVAVADVTSDFLARADEAEGWTLEEATWFLAICAILLELKVGRLFPQDQRLDEEDLVGGSPDLAYARSLELAAIRRVADTFAEMLARGALFHPRQAGPPEEFAHLYPDPLERVTAEDIGAAAAAALRPSVVDLTHVAPIRASVTDALERVRARLARRGEARFRELVRDCRDRIQVVVRFLALLELHARGQVALRQAETFGEIEVRWQG